MIGKRAGAAFGFVADAGGEPFAVKERQDDSCRTLDGARYVMELNSAEIATQAAAATAGR